MSVVKTKRDAPNSGATLRRSSKKGQFFAMSEWREALSELQEGRVVHDRIGERMSERASHWLDIGSSTFLETEDIFGLLKPTYRMDGERAIRSWLEHYPGARQILLLLPSTIRAYFPAPDLRLEVRTDPETDEQRLGIYIQTDLDPEEAIECFTAFDSTWGDRLHSFTDGDILINVESKS